MTLKASVIFLVALLLGSLVGTGLTLARFGNMPTALGPVSESLPEGEKEGQVAATQRDFDCGIVDRGAKVSHAFRFTNVGQGVLRLKAGETSCSACTIALLEQVELGPGESTHVTIEYSAPLRAGKFRQTATVLTSDPLAPRIELTILGDVASKFRVIPTRLHFGNVGVGEAATVESKVLYFPAGDIRVESHSFGFAETAELYELTTQPMPPEELLSWKANSGVQLTIALKPGLPLGHFGQTILVKLVTSPDNTSYEELVEVQGIIVSDLVVVGPGVHANGEVLTLGAIPRGQGTSRSLRILARGNARQTIELETIKVDPPEMQVTLGPRSTLGEKVEQIPLTVEIPANLPPMVRMGTEQSPFGEIVLGIKNHPELDRIRLRVRFVIE